MIYGIRSVNAVAMIQVKALHQKKEIKLVGDAETMLEEIIVIEL